MTLFAFLPVLFALSSYVTELPLVGAIPAPLFTAALVWSIFGTGLLALAGIQLPGLYFRNQRVEAAYRKEPLPRLPPPGGAGLRRACGGGGGRHRPPQAGVLGSLFILPPS